MRNAAFLFALMAACGSGTSGRGATVLPGTTEVVRVVYNSYRKGATVLVMENEAGRNLVKLRSRKLKEGESPVAFVPDDVMAKMFEEFERYGFSKFARPRPGNPMRFGAVGELTVITQDRTRMTSLLRTKRSAGAEVGEDYIASNTAYVNCANTYVVVYNHYGPRLQATTSKNPFGVKRADG